jgi:hypothetical protein
MPCLYLVGIHLVDDILEGFVIDRVTVVYWASFVSHDRPPRFGIDASLSHLVMCRLSQVVNVEIDGVSAIGLKPSIRYNHSLTPQPAELFDSLAVLVAPQVEPEEHPWAFGVEPIPNSELLPKISFHFQLTLNRDKALTLGEAWLAE